LASSIPRGEQGSQDSSSDDYDAISTCLFHIRWRFFPSVSRDVYGGKFGVNYKHTLSLIQQDFFLPSGIEHSGVLLYFASQIRGMNARIGNLKLYKK